MTTLEMAQLTVYGATVGIILAAPIGPINIEIVRRGIRDGFLHGWMMGLGALTADTIYALAIVTGFARFAENQQLRIVLFLVGAGMMAYIGFGSIKSAMRETNLENSGLTIPRSKSYAAGFMLAAFNPFGIVYWLTVGAGLAADAVNRFGEGGAPILVIGVMLGIFLWVTSISTVAQISRRFVTGPAMRWITGISGVLLFGFAGWFLYSGVSLLL